MIELMIYSIGLMSGLIIALLLQPRRIIIASQETEQKPKIKKKDIQPTGVVPLTPQRENDYAKLKHEEEGEW